MIERNVSPCRWYNAASALSSRSVIAPISASSVAELKPSLVNVGAIIAFEVARVGARHRCHQCRCLNRAHATNLHRSSRREAGYPDRPTGAYPIYNEESGNEAPTPPPPLKS